MAPDGCYFYCDEKGCRSVAEWLKKNGLVYKEFYADFMEWCKVAAIHWRQDIADELEKKAVSVLRQWPTDANGMIALMESFRADEDLDALFDYTQKSSRKKFPFILSPLIHISLLCLSRLAVPRLMTRPNHNYE